MPRVVSENISLFDAKRLLSKHSLIFIINELDKIIDDPEFINFYPTKTKEKIIEKLRSLDSDFTNKYTGLMFNICGTRNLLILFDKNNDNNIDYSDSTNTTKSIHVIYLYNDEVYTRPEYFMNNLTNNIISVFRTLINKITSLLWK